MAPNFIFVPEVHRILKSLYFKNVSFCSKFKTPLDMRGAIWRNLRNVCPA